MRLLRKIYETTVILTLTALIVLAYVGYMSYTNKGATEGIRQCIEMFSK